MRGWRAFCRRSEGAISILAAVSATAMIGMAALGVDVGAVYLRSRELQGVADIAAMTAAQDLGRAQARAEAAVRANRAGQGVRVRTELGRYVPDPARPAAQRFVPGVRGANAVRVRLDGDAPLYFGALFVAEGRMQVGRNATAAQARLASFQIGSRLLALRGGIANALLGGLAGGAVNLSVMDYQSLLRANIDLFSFTDALRTRLDLEAASYDRVLAQEVTAPLALGALADALVASGARDAGRAIERLAHAASRQRVIDGLDTLIDLGPYGGQDQAPDGSGAAVGVNAFDLAMALLELANGERQVALDLSAGAPGLAGVRAWLAIGERPNNSPWLAITGSDEVIIRTAQMRLYIEADVNAAAPIARIRVPLVMEAASAQARLSDITCGPTQASRRVTLEASPSLGMVALAEIDRGRLGDFKRPLTLRPARLVELPLIRAEGAGRIDLGGDAWQEVTFRGDEIARGEMKTVQTRDIAQATFASLMREIDLDVRVAGLGLNLGGVTRAIATPLSATAPVLDDLVNGLTDVLGVRLGEADLRVNGVRCDGSALVG